MDETAGANTEVAVFSAGQSSHLWTALTDVHFRTVTTHRAAPALFRIVLASTAVTYVAVAGFAFHLSAWLGVAWLLGVGPVVCVGAILVWRMAIELLLAVLIMMEQLDETSEVVLDIAEITTGLSLKAELIPTLPSFVRSVRSRRTGYYQQQRARLLRRDETDIERYETDADSAQY